MNARFPANFLRNALLVLLGLTVQAGHTQTVVCPAGIIPPNSQCATPIFGPWQYQALHVFDNMDSALNEIMGSILAHPEIYFGYSVCANTIAFSGVVKDWCPGNNACRVWGGQYIDFTQTHEVTASLRNDLTPGCPVSTFVLPTLRQSRTLTCPSGYSLIGATYEVTSDPPQPVDPNAPSQVFACATSAAAQIQLVGLHTIEPEKPLSANALVTDASGNPLPGAIVHLRIDAVPNSGGHTHGDDNSPLRRGKLSGVGPEIVATVPTGPDGVFGFTFNAPSVSGAYQITASCDDRPCVQVGAKTVDVKVDGLFTLAALSAYNFAGGTAAHPDNHYLILTAAAVAQRLAIHYRNTFPTSPVLTYNDASLNWGGTFDITCASGASPCNWASPHSEHKRGVVMDVRANRTVDAIPVANYKKFRQLVRMLGGDPHYECDPAQAHTKPCTEHFHVRLLGRAE